MQIVGGRWEVCLGDGSCVLSFLSFPFAFFNLYIIGQICSLRPGPPLPADSGPEPGPPAPAPCPNAGPSESNIPRAWPPPCLILTSQRPCVFALLTS